MSKVVGLSKNSYKPITNMAWVRARLCKLQKGCTWLTATSDKVYQLLADGRWFSPGTPASSTTKTGRHDIAEILMKVALNTKNQSKINYILIRHNPHTWPQVSYNNSRNVSICLPSILILCVFNSHFCLPESYFVSISPYWYHLYCLLPL